MAYSRFAGLDRRAVKLWEGGIVCKEGRVVWYALDEAMWRTPAKSDGKKVKQRTTLEAYDFEFEFRRDIAAVAVQHDANAATELLVEPMRCSDCPTCPWLEVCNVTLLAGSGDASLLPQLSYPQWRALRNAAIRNRAGRPVSLADPRAVEEGDLFFDGRPDGH